MKNVIYLYSGFFEYEKLLGIKKDGNIDLFKAKIKEIQDDCDNACIVISSLNEVYELFRICNFEIDTEGAFNNGSSITINDKDSFLKIINSGRSATDNIYKAWIYLLHDISEDIDTFYRYGYAELSEDMNFLKNLLVFMSGFVI